MSVVEEVSVAALSPDDKNANRGTVRGRQALEQSLERFGAGRAILVDKHGRIIAGNKTLDKYMDLGNESVLLVRSDGSKLVAVMREDLDLDDAETRALAIADNRVGELDLDWDTDALKELKTIIEDADIDLDVFFTDEEFSKLFKEEEPPPPPKEVELKESYAVVVELKSETEQVDLLQRLTDEGYVCRALIS